PSRRSGTQSWTSGSSRARLRARVPGSQSMRPRAHDLRARLRDEPGVAHVLRARSHVVHAGCLVRDGHHVRGRGPDRHRHVQAGRNLPARLQPRRFRVRLPVRGLDVATARPRAGPARHLRDQLRVRRAVHAWQLRRDRPRLPQSLTHAEVAASSSSSSMSIGLPITRGRSRSRNWVARGVTAPPLMNTRHGSSAG
ncbi:MAG: hypothetical protein JWL86_6999, partial [Rhizobium sp.]|nr:hypothetical protein [Rhizobium sp.]